MIKEKECDIYPAKKYVLAKILKRKKPYSKMEIISVNRFEKCYKVGDIVYIREFDLRSVMDKEDYLIEKDAYLVGKKDIVAKRKDKLEKISLIM